MKNPSTISTRHVEAKCKTQERKTKTINQNSSNETKKPNAKMNGIELCIEMHITLTSTLSFLVLLELVTFLRQKKNTLVLTPKTPSIAFFTT
jgi:hypothetical protein